MTRLYGHIVLSASELHIRCEICKKEMNYPKGMHSDMWKRMLSEFKKKHRPCSKA